MNVRLLVILAGGAAMVWSFRRWRTALQLALVLMIFEGAIRKWIFPGAQDLIYFAKDVLLLGVYGGFLRDRSRLRMRPLPQPLLYGLLALSVLLGLLQIFNPALPNLLVGLSGFKAYFFYVPLVFVVPAALPSDAALYRFLRRYCLISIPVGLLAMAQFLSPASSMLNTYARTNEEAYIATFGSSTHVRVTATFSFITGYSSYLLAMAILVLCLVAAARWQFRGNLLMFGALGLTLLPMLMTGSRGPVLFLVLLFPFYWWLAVIRERGGGVAFGRLLVALGLVGGILVSTGQNAIDAFRGRAEAGSDMRNRITSPLLSPYLLLPDSGLTGFGIGATHQTAPTLAPGLAPYSWLHGLLVEVESGRVMLELGAVGFLLIYFLRAYLSFFALRQVFTLRTRFHRALATASFLFSLTALPGVVVFDVTSDVYYWFFAGLLLLAIRLDREAVRKAAVRAAAGRPPAAVAIPPEPALPAAVR
jgi:hypothetical protein